MYVLKNNKSVSNLNKVQRTPWPIEEESSHGLHVSQKSSTCTINAKVFEQVQVWPLNESKAYLLPVNCLPTLQWSQFLCTSMDQKVPFTHS